MVTAAPSAVLKAGDCRAEMGRLAEKSIGVVVTSPPYNIGAGYGLYEDKRPAQDYLDWMDAVMADVHRVLKEDGSFFLNVGGTPQNPWTPWDVAQRARRLFVLQNQIVWVKSIAIPRVARGAGPDRDLAFGHYKPLRSERFLHGAHEFVFHFTKTGRVPLDRLAVGVPYQDKSNIGRWDKEQDRRCRGNVWFVPYKTIQSRKLDRPHPAAFPVALVDMCLKLHGVKRAGTVMDPFMGLGSTGVAAGRLGLPFVGFDIDPTYVSEAKRWIENEGVAV